MLAGLLLWIVLSVYTFEFIIWWTILHYSFLLILLHVHTRVFSFYRSSHAYGLVQLTHILSFLLMYNPFFRKRHSDIMCFFVSSDSCIGQPLLCVSVCNIIFAWNFVRNAWYCAAVNSLSVSPFRSPCDCKWTFLVNWCFSDRATQYRRFSSTNLMYSFFIL